MERLIIPVGRGNGGTRLIASTLRQSGVYMGEPLNFADDLVPPDEMYEACRIMARKVRYLGGYRWDFSLLHTGTIDPAFKRLVESYLSSVLESDEPLRGWKIPETTLCYPWIVRMFPDAHYITWSRDPRDALLGFHMTDELALFGVPRPYMENLLEVRSVSWLYQDQILNATPKPRNVVHVRFEDFVLKQQATLAKLEGFLGFALHEVRVDTSQVGWWQRNPGQWQQEPMRPDFPEFLLDAIWD